MRTLLIIASLVLVLCCTGSLSSQEVKTTRIRVIAYEYYDEYQLPERKKWRKVRSIKIEAQNRTGSVQVIQTGPEVELEAVIEDITVPSEYWVTIVWQGGERFYQSYTTSPQQEVVHRIYQPF